MKIERKFVRVILLVASYVDVFLLAAAGIFVFWKGNEDNKKDLKNVFFLYLIFLAASAFLALYNNLIMNVFNASGAAYDIYRVLTGLVNVSKIGVYAFFIIRELFSFNKKKKEQE